MLDAGVQWVLDQLEQKSAQVNALIYNCLVDASVQWVLDQLKQKSSQMNELIYDCLVDVSAVVLDQQWRITDDCTHLQLLGG